MLDRDEAVREAARFLAEASSSWGPSSNIRIIPEYCFTDQSNSSLRTTTSNTSTTAMKTCNSGVIFRSLST